MIRENDDDEEDDEVIQEITTTTTIGQARIQMIGDRGEEGQRSTIDRRQRVCVTTREMNRR